MDVAQRVSRLEDAAEEALSRISRIERKLSEIENRLMAAEVEVKRLKREARDRA